MKHYSRILFVDADDTARAPMAKAILQSKELPWPMEIGSRGLVVLFPQPVNQKVEAVLARNGRATAARWRRDALPGCR